MFLRFPLIFIHLLLSFYFFCGALPHTRAQQLPIDVSDWPAGAARLVETDASLTVSLYASAADAPPVRVVDLFARDDPVGAFS